MNQRSTYNILFFLLFSKTADKTLKSHSVGYNKNDLLFKKEDPLRQHSITSCKIGNLSAGQFRYIKIGVGLVRLQCGSSTWDSIDGSDIVSQNDRLFSRFTTTAGVEWVVVFTIDGMWFDKLYFLDLPKWATTLKAQLIRAASEKIMGTENVRLKSKGGQNPKLILYIKRINHCQGWMWVFEVINRQLSELSRRCVRWKSSLLVAKADARWDRWSAESLSLLTFAGNRLMYWHGYVTHLRATARSHEIVFNICIRSS